MSRLSKNVATSLLFPPCHRESLHKLERKEANLPMTKDSRERDCLCRKMLSGLVVGFLAKSVVPFDFRPWGKVVKGVDEGDWFGDSAG